MGMKGIAFRNGHIFVNNVEITHFTDDDDCVKFERNSESFMYKVGADGHTCLSFSADKSGKCTLKLQPTSPSNSYLSKLLAAGENGTETFIPVVINFQDVSRKDIAMGNLGGCIIKVPDFMRGKDNSGNGMEWVFFLARYDLLVANPSFAGYASQSAEAAAF